MRGWGRKSLVCSLAAVLACISSAAFASAAVQFQGRIYDVTAITPSATVPLYSTNDLIFLQDLTGNKFLVIPTDVTLRGDYDIALQRFFILDGVNPGNVISFNRINGALLDLNAQFIKTIQQDTTGVIDSYLQPLQITETARDISIIDSNLLAYRTDGATPNTNTDEKIYVITRTNNSSVVPPSPFIMPLKNASFPFVQFDPNNLTFLTVQQTLDINTNADTRHRISAFNAADGSLNSEIILDNLNNLDPNLGFTGNTGGMTLDPGTGVIYLLDAGSNNPVIVPRKIFAFTPRIPRLISISPTKGTFTGGTTVTLTGVAFPSDSQVFFDGIAATSINVVSSTTITAVTPAHAVGAVDVTITGTNISKALTLAGGYTYINVPPQAALTASPNLGLPPLSVLFNIGASADIDGTLAFRKIDFGDGTIFTFPNDLTVVDTTHTYLAVGTFVATLTVTDNLGASATATQTIIVGTGGDDISANDLVLRELAFNIKGNSKDTVKIRGEFPLPDQVDLNSANIVVGYGGATSEIQFDTVGLKPKGYVNFKLKLLNKLGFPPNTYTFTLSQNNQALRDTFLANNIDLTKSGVQTMQVFIRVTTESGRVIVHTKPAAVINIRASKNNKRSSVSLKRN